MACAGGKLETLRCHHVLHRKDEEYPFLHVDVTKQAKGIIYGLDSIQGLNRMQKENEVTVEPGDQGCNPM